MADHVFSGADVFGGPSEKDSLSLAPRVWLADVGFVLLGPGVCLEVTVTEEGGWETADRSVFVVCCVCLSLSLFVCLTV